MLPPFGAQLYASKFVDATVLIWLDMGMLHLRREDIRF